MIFYFFKEKFKSWWTVSFGVHIEFFFNKIRVWSIQEGISVIILYDLIIIIIVKLGRHEFKYWPARVLRARTDQGILLILYIAICMHGLTTPTTHSMFLDKCYMVKPDCPDLFSRLIESLHGYFFPSLAYLTPHAILIHASADRVVPYIHED